MALVIRKIGGGSQIGTVVLDAMISLSQRLEVQWSEERIATGARASDHSQILPKVYTITGGVSNLPSALLDAALTGGVSGLANNLQAQAANAIDNLSPVETNLNTRAQDAQDDLEELVRAREEFEFVSFKGKFTLIPLTLETTADFNTGDSFQFTMTARELLRGEVTVISNPTDLSDSLVGSGTESAKGPTRLGPTETLNISA